MLIIVINYQIRPILPSKETTVQANQTEKHKTESIKRTQKLWQRPTPERTILFVLFSVFFWSVTIFILPDFKHLHVILFDNNAVPRFRMDAHSHLFYFRFYSLRSRVNGDNIIHFFFTPLDFAYVCGIFLFGSNSASGKRVFCLSCSDHPCLQLQLEFKCETYDKIGNPNMRNLIVAKNKTTTTTAHLPNT